jgi:hypothetical protein
MMVNAAADSFDSGIPKIPAWNASNSQPKPSRNIADRGCSPAPGKTTTLWQEAEEGKS